MKAWGFEYKTNIVWFKVRKDGGPDGRGVGFYYRNVTELLLFGVKGKLRTLAPGRRQVNIVITRKREHSRKPDEVYKIVEQCSPGPYLELFAREPVPGWTQWGDCPLVPGQSIPLLYACGLDEDQGCRQCRTFVNQRARGETWNRLQARSYTKGTTYLTFKGSTDGAPASAGINHSPDALSLATAI